MDDYSKYIEDKRFVRWVLHPNPETEAHWDQYLKDHPSEKDAVSVARTILSQLKSKNTGDQETALHEIYMAVIRQADHRRKFKKTLFTVAKYAAVAFIFLSLGILWHNTGKKSVLPEPAGQVALQPESDENETRLILPDGKSIVIAEKESSVLMQEKGKIVINQKDTIQPGSVKAGAIQLIVPFGRNSSVRLPDGTMAYLNAGSRLTYPSQFDGGQRNVSLSGEGFFDVARNPDAPFTVTTTDLGVTALGTSFNVSAYPGDPFIEVVLEKGKVGLTETGVQDKQQILIPNQLAAFNRENRQTAVKNVNVENYISWHKGYLNMESTDLSRIAAKLERYYNIEIDFENPLAGSKAISGKIVLKEEKEKILAVLASTASLELIKINEQKYVLK